MIGRPTKYLSGNPKAPDSLDPPKKYEQMYADKGVDHAAYYAPSRRSIGT